MKPLQGTMTVGDLEFINLQKGRVVPRVEKALGEVSSKMMVTQRKRIEITTPAI